ncbi:MAG: ATP-binding protein [Candidatus Odinarchaeota archaeon]|nr:ATP-binding protein [Candidatus Odinarchaeota archaeon]
MKIGRVISLGETPNTQEFYVLAEPEIASNLEKGLYVEIPYQVKLLVGLIVDIIKTNRYFSQIESVAEFERSGSALDSLFPIDLWEYTLLKIKSLGILDKSQGKLSSCNIPPSPGDRAFLASYETLSKILGFNTKGIFLGKLLGHGYEVKLDLTKLFRKHVAILAMSGAGKSYTTSVLLEELMLRKPSEGRVSIIVFDVHGEYVPFSLNDSPFINNVHVINASEIQFSMKYINRSLFSSFLPQLSEIQIRELMRVISKMRNAEKKFTLESIISKIQISNDINPRTKEALLGWLYMLKETYFFSDTENPFWENLMKPGKLIILNLSNLISLYKKQLVVTYVLHRLFSLRRNNRIPPVIAVIEEAHQFCPEARREEAISKGIIETIAREGRKFYFSLCLISQRPVRLSTTALSQCNTQIILRITNPYDLQHIGASSEHIDRRTLDMISSLSVGEALITGEVVNFPIFVKIRKRQFIKVAPFEESIEEIAKKYETL